VSLRRALRCVGWSSHCALNAARCIVVCQVRLSAKRIITRQYARLVDEWAPAIGRRREDYGTHSLRRTKAIIHKTTGHSRAVQLLLVHTKIESTVRYLGINVEDVLILAEHTEV
jgi:site-specific recombinase XerC